MRVFVAAFLSAFLVQTSLYAKGDQEQNEAVETIVMSPLDATLLTDPVDAMRAGYFHMLKWQFVLTPISIVFHLLTATVRTESATTTGASQPSAGSANAAPVAQPSRPFIFLIGLLVKPTLEELEYHGFYLSFFHYVTWLEARILRLFSERESSRAVTAFIRQGHRLALAAWFGIVHERKLNEPDAWRRFLLPASTSYFVLQPLAQEKGLLASIMAHICWNALFVHSGVLLSSAYLQLLSSAINFKLWARGMAPS